MEKLPSHQLAFYGTPASDQERFKILDRTIELGWNFIDTADVYEDNEELIGIYFKTYPQKRKKVRITNKRIFKPLEFNNPKV
ncbi:unnamed protein product [Rotaria sp. Silwood1]|nr:unnamed protein product [Rotaria sp. Silwood1]